MERVLPGFIMAGKVTMDVTPQSLSFPTGGVVVQNFGGGWVGFEEEFVSAPTEPQSTLTLYMAQQKLLSNLQREVEALRAEIIGMKELLESRPLVSSSQLFDLGDDRLMVGVPIPLTLEESDNESLAQWPEIGVSGVGATLSEAIGALRSEIVELYLDLSARDPGALGPPAASTYRLLRLHVATR